MYRTIDVAFWTDPKIKKLDVYGKLLFLYLVTNPHTHVSGIYCLDLRYAALDTGYPINTLSKALDTLSRLGMCAFDSDKNVIWVKRMFHHQGRGEKNLRSAAHHLLEDLHKSKLIPDFLAEYPEVKRYLPDTLSIPYSASGNFGTPEQEQDPEQEQEQEGEPVAPLPEPLLRFGEFGNVRLTSAEEVKLRARLNGTFDYYVTRLDCWGAEDPVAFRKKKNHYAVLVNWSGRDEKEGRGPHGPCNVFAPKDPRETPGSTSERRTSKGDLVYIPKQ